MKTTKLALIFGLLALVILAGCTQSTPRPPPPGQGYIGGGCGVSAPAETQPSIVDLVSTASEEKIAA